MEVVKRELKYWTDANSAPQFIELAEGDTWYTSQVAGFGAGSSGVPPFQLSICRAPKTNPNTKTAYAVNPYLVTRGESKFFVLGVVKVEEVRTTVEFVEKK